MGEVRGSDAKGSFSTRDIDVQVSELGQREPGEAEAVGEDEVGTFSTRNIGVQVAELEQGVVEGLGGGVDAGAGVVQGQVFDVVSTRNRQKCVFFGNSV